MATGHQPSVNRHAVAEQVIVSAGDILVAAGFGREEIGSFFRQAADQLAPVAGLSEVMPTTPAPTGLASLLAAFEHSKPVSQLRQLIVQAQAVLPLRQEGAELKLCFDLAMQMTPLLAEAQNSLRTLAEESGLRVFVTREEWRTAADTSHRPEAGPAVCLEEFETPYRGAFTTIAVVLDELMRRDDHEAFSFLLGHLAENSVVIDHSLHAAIERGMRTRGV